MTGRGGYIIHFDEGRRQEIIHYRLEADGIFSDTLSAPDWLFKAREIGLASFDNKSLEGAFLITKGKRVATQKHRVEFSRWVSFAKLPLEEIEQRLKIQLRSHFVRASVGKGDRIPDKTWESVWSVLVEERPEVGDKLKELEKLRTVTPERYQREAYRALNEERDAVGLALSVFGLDRKKDLGVVLPLESDVEVAPFLKNMEKAPLREWTMVNHDAGIIPGWDIHKKYQIGAVEFINGKDVLTIVNVNCQPLETTLGVDLIYYHHRFQSFVMVQYKRLREEPGSRWVYRPSHDDSYEPEMARMKKWQQGFEKEHTQSSSKSYRLHPGPFYFKFARPETYDPLSSDLIRGMYVPLDLWLEMEDRRELEGPRGGMMIDFNTDRRYLNNTEFIALVQGGWVGTRLLDTNRLSDVINGGLKGNKSVIIATQRR